MPARLANVIFNESRSAYGTFTLNNVGIYKDTSHTLQFAIKLIIIIIIIIIICYSKSMQSEKTAR